jgi:hypothetical protein
MPILFFPGLKYRVDAPSLGKDFFIQLNVEPGKRIQVHSRFKIESKEGNAPEPSIQQKN